MQVNANSQSLVVALYVPIRTVTPEIRFAGIPVKVTGSEESSALRVALSVHSMRTSPLSKFMSYAF